MNWVQRVLTDTEDNGRYLSGLGAALGGCIATLPLLFGALDAETVLIATLVGSIVATPLWRFVGEAFDRQVDVQVGEGSSMSLEGPAASVRQGSRANRLF